ncbi:hypothetical protein ACQV2B_00830 [Pantoea allii]|uniref:hypothetical protein n=1 Tax=Pantoea allii TaxID=574096 RepID=UPI003D3144FF
MKIYAAFFVASIAVFSVSCFAETLCSKTSNDAELYQCSVKYKSQAEKELNHEYGLARERIVQMYGAQKNWVSSMPGLWLIRSVIGLNSGMVNVILKLLLQKKAVIHTMSQRISAFIEWILSVQPYLNSCHTDFLTS